MKLLLDVCVSSRLLESFLLGKGHDVLSAVAIDPTATDEMLMAEALHDDRVLVTQDKDFGELVFVRGLPHGPLVRLVEMSVDQQVAAIAELLEHHADDLCGRVIVTVTRGRIRIRR